MLRILTYVNRSAYSHPLLERTLHREQRIRHLADIDYVNREVDSVIEQRQRDCAGEHGDLLDRMLTVADPETGQQLDPENIRYQILTFLAAGHETSAGVMAFALHYLSIHP
jgi:unspecific monooxygenase